MLNIQKSLLIVAWGLAALPAFAGEGAGQAYINWVGGWGGTNGSLLFFHTETRTNIPTCAAGTTGGKVGRFVIDLATVVGQAQYSLILSAQTSGKEIRVLGLGNCDKWSDSETVRSVGFN